VDYYVLIFSLCSFPAFYFLNLLKTNFLWAHPVGYSGVCLTVCTERTSI